MHLGVGGKVGAGAEATATLGTGKGTFARVHASVPCQVLPVGETAPAVWTAEGPLASVGPLVCHQPWTLAEAFPAVSAGKGFDGCVGRRRCPGGAPLTLAPRAL